MQYSTVLFILSIIEFRTVANFQIFQDGRAAGSNPVSGNYFVNKTYLENYSVEQKTYLADLDPLKASASLVPSLSSSVTTINSKTGSWDNLEGLPAVSSTDNSKILMVVDGSWNLVSPSVIYSGTNAPANTTGNDGDVYLQI